MAARVKGFDKLNLSLRLCRNVLLQNERFLSTSACLRGTSEPPKFVPPSKPVIIDKEQTVESRRKFLSPEFIPPRQRTLPFKFRLERADMVRRRKVLKIPEFYVGVEMNYDLYSPRIQSIEVLKLEKRLDDDLMYLRDALSEYSMVDPEMKPVPIPTTGDVPVNKLKVVMRPRPWSKHWDWSKFNIQGIRFDLCKSIKATAKAKKQERPWLEYDMLKEYDTSELEERIYEEVQQEMKK
ncbi:large ribosomal subunit protein bL19m isoform X2 [Austrofundulus limnaeus]|uniref:Large ribosomal subunit protein bL19m n=1 Tax=Austrofundulus limnaeus TaxID=52670 RepID=A0A2I4BCG5_AUSLI|nr:PREDICTED: 39S ribosomal protein L19, mitochondrial isoform X2 [Austrofundulus limnaeus]